MDDARLVVRTRQGDAGAFESLVRRHQRTALLTALAIVGGRADAEDVCQESWVRALQRIDELREPGRFLHWLLQIVRNGARNRLEHRRVRMASSLETNEVAGREDPRQDLRLADLRSRLETALAQLPEIQRTIVLLHDLDGWKHRAIAEELDLSEVMSRQHLFQARRRLRELLGVDAIEEMGS